MSHVEFDYVEESGPGVLELPAAPAAEEDPPVTEIVEVPPLWEQETVEKFLQGTGVGLHMLAGVAERDWLMTEKDLERIAPPLTRIANRYEPLQRLSPYADPLLLAHGFALYGWRSGLERKRAQRDAEELATGERYERVVEEPPAEPSEASAEEAPEEERPYFPESPRARS